MGKECRVEHCPRDVYSRTGYCEMHYRRALRSGDPGPPGPLCVRGVFIAPARDEPVDARDHCHGHYQRLDRHGEVDLSPLRKGKSMCKVETCDRDAERRGYCQAHYKRVLKYGHPQVAIPTREVDGKGHMSHGYRVINVPKKLRYLSKGSTKMAEHRFAMAKHLDRPLRSDEDVHHLNGVKTDNRLGSGLDRTQVGCVLKIPRIPQTIIELYGEEFDLFPQAS